MKYVILDLIEVVVQGDGFCRRGSRMSEKNYETSELKELNGNSGKYEANDVVGKTGIEKTMESTLQGKKGQKDVLVDNLGKVIIFLMR